MYIRVIYMIYVSNFTLTRESSMKTNRFLSLAAVFAIALTFFACSSETEPSPPPSEPSSNSSGGEMVSCKLNTGTCSQKSYSACKELVDAGEATIVSNCNAEPPPPPSSSIPSSSSSILPISSSSSLADDKDLKRSSFELSLAGASYGDIDVARTYQQSGLASAKDKIDLVAYYTAGASDNILNPCNVPTIGEDCGGPEFYSIPAKYHTSLKTATKASQIADFLSALANDEISLDDPIDKVSISMDKAFLVFSTSMELYVVVITDTGTGKVSLNFFNLSF
jgi:hypothetical protein